MSLYIEIGNTQIRIVDMVKNKKNGGIKVNVFKDIYGIVDQAMIDTLPETIKQMKVKSKKASLIISNNSVYYKEMRLPLVDDKQLKQIVSNEVLVSQLVPQEIISDYIELETLENEKRVLACALPVDKLTEYDKIFTDIKCKRPKTIEVGYNTLFSYFFRVGLPEINDPFIALQVSKGTIRAFLFDQGIFILALTTRARGDYEDLMATLKGEISKIFQFQAGRRRPAVGTMYIYGDYNGLETIVADCKEEFNIKVDLLPKPVNLEAPLDFNHLAYVHALGCIMGE